MSGTQKDLDNMMGALKEGLSKDFNITSQGKDTFTLNSLKSAKTPRSSQVKATKGRMKPVQNKAEKIGKVKPY